MKLKVGVNADGSYELGPRTYHTLKNEIDLIMFSVVQDLPDSVDIKCEGEKEIVESWRNDMGDNLRNVLGLNVSKRLLNVFNPLNVKVHFTTKPDRKYLSIFLKRYNFVAFKRLAGVVNTFAAQVKTIDDFDALCTAKSIHCGAAKITITPFYRFSQCPKKIKSVFCNPELMNYKGNTESSKKDDKATDENITSTKNKNVKNPLKTEVTKEPKAEPVVNKQAANNTSNDKEKSQAKVTASTIAKSTVKVEKIEPPKPKLESSKPTNEPLKTKGDTPKPKTEPLKTKVEPAKPKVEPAVNKIEPAKTKAESVKPKVEPCVNKIEPAKTKAESVKPKVEPSVNKIEPAKTKVESTPKVETTVNKIEPAKTKVEPAKPKVEPVNPKTESPKDKIKTPTAKVVPTKTNLPSPKAGVPKSAPKAKTTTPKPVAPASTSQKSIEVPKANADTPKPTAGTPKPVQPVKAKYENIQKVGSKTTAQVDDKTKNTVKVVVQNKNTANSKTTPAKTVVKTPVTSNKKVTKVQAITNKNVTAKKNVFPNKKATKKAIAKDDYEELDDHDILALISEGIVIDECSGSDED